MKIIREGKEFELEQFELGRAYREYQHAMDIEDILDAVKGSDRFQDLLSNEKLLDMTAYRYRKYIDGGMSSDAFWEDLEDAYDFSKKVLDGYQ